MKLYNLALLLPLAFSSANALACEINLAYDVIESPPYYVGNGETIPDKPGATIELVNLAAARIKCKINWQRMPNKRITLELERNALDGMLAMSYRKERTSFLVYPMKGETPDSSLAVTNLNYSFFVRPGTTLKWDGQHFNHPPASIGANAGYSIAKDLAALGLTVEEAPGALNNLRKLLYGRIEVYAAHDVPIDILRERDEFKQVEKLTPPIVNKDYFLVYSKGYYAQSSDTANRLWKQISELNATHTKALLRKYHVE